MKKRNVISRKLLIEIKLSKKPAYHIAQKAGISPSTLSKLMCDIEPIKDDDPRVIAVGKVMELKASQCFGVEITEG